MREAKAIGALVDSCVGEREVAMDGIVLADLRTEAGSNKTIPDPVSFAARSDRTRRTGPIVFFAVRHNVRDRRILQIAVHRDQIRVVLIHPFDYLRDVVVSIVIVKSEKPIASPSSYSTMPKSDTLVISPLQYPAPRCTRQMAFQG